MDETAALPACLTDPSVLYVEVNDWGDMLYLVQKRLDGTGRRKTGWFVVTIAGDQSFWDGPYTFRKALARFDQQCNCLRAVLSHTGVLESAEHSEPSKPERVIVWNETDWDRGWSVVSSRLIGAPAMVDESPEFQAIKTKLDRTFMAGDASTFAEAGVQLIELCEQVVARDGIAAWWKVTN